MKLKIFKDGTNVTYGYNLDSEDENVGIIMTSDGYESSDAIIADLKSLSKALTAGLKNIEKE